MALQFRRGTQAQLNSIVPAEGEPIWTTDTNILSIGDGVTPGGIYVTEPGAKSNQALYTTSTVEFAGLTVAGNTFPNYVGADNQVLATDSFGNLFWKNDASGVQGDQNVYTTSSVEFSNLTIQDDGVIYASHGAYGPPDGTFAHVRVGLYGTNPAYAIGIETNNSWIQGQDGVKLYSADGVRLSASTAGVKINDVYTLPTTDGSNGQYIITDGSGNLSWASTGGGTGNIGFSSNTIYNTANEGIVISPTSGATSVVLPTDADSLSVPLQIINTGTAGVTITAGSYNTTFGTDGDATVTFPNKVVAGIYEAGEGGFGSTGYTFQNDGGFDTGMFSNADGYLQFYNNSVLTAEVTTNGWAFSDITLNSDFVKLGSGSQLGSGVTDGVAIGKDAIVLEQAGIAIGNSSSAQLNSISIGKESEASGPNSISIGYLANNPSSYSVANAIVINATGDYLTVDQSGLFVAPIRDVANNKVVYYNTATSEVTYSDPITPSPVTGVYARSGLPAGVIGMIITVSDSGSDTNSPAGNYAPAYWDNDANTWTYIGNSNSVTFIGLNWTPNLTNVDQDPGDPRIFTSNSADTGWDAQVYSSESYNKCFVEYQALQTDKTFMMGLNTNPTINDSWNYLQNRFTLFDNGTVQIWDTNNAYQVGYGSYTTSTTFRVEYDSGTINYYIDGSLVRTTGADVTGAHFMDSSFADMNGSVKVLGFGTY